MQNTIEFKYEKTRLANITKAPFRPVKRSKVGCFVSQA